MAHAKEKRDVPGETRRVSYSWSDVVTTGRK